MTTQRQAHHRPHLTTQLTRRQRDVLARVADGKTNPEIAAELGITLDGVKWHVGEILARLGVSTREEAAAAWRSEQSKLARLRRALGFAPLAAKPMVVAGGTGLLVSGLIVLIVAMVARGVSGPESMPVPTESVETPVGASTSTPGAIATTTALPDGARAQECGLGDVAIHTHWDPIPRGTAILGGYSLISRTTCRLVGDLTVTILDGRGQLVDMPGNPAIVPLDIDVLSTGLAAAGVRITWTNSCAYQAQDYVFRLAIPVNSVDSSPHPSYPKEIGTGCDSDTSLSVQEAHWDRHSYLSNVVPAGTFASNSLPLAAIPGEPLCGFNEWVCQAVGYIEHWIANREWSRPAAFSRSLYFVCGEVPDFLASEDEARTRIVDMDDDACAGKKPADQVDGAIVLDTGTQWMLDSSLSAWSAYTRYGQAERIVSVGCALKLPGCLEFVLAMEFSDSDDLVYVAYVAGGAMTVDRASNVGWGRTDAPEARTGGRAITVFGETEFIPLP